MHRFVQTSTAIFSVTTWLDNETHTEFFDVYVDGKFKSRHTSMTEVQSAILKILHDRRTK